MIDVREVFQQHHRDAGCIVVVRPDQYVAHVLPLDAHDELTDFLSGVLTEAIPAQLAASTPVAEM
jgi:hypothetical protein